MKVRVYYFVDNNGDGSASPLFFSTFEEALAYEEAMDEACGDNFTEGPGSADLEFDDEGQLLNGTKPFTDD